MEIWTGGWKDWSYMTLDRVEVEDIGGGCLLDTTDGTSLQHYIEHRPIRLFILGMHYAIIFIITGTEIN